MKQLVDVIDKPTFQLINQYLDDSDNSEEAVPYGDLAQAVMEAASLIRDKSGQGCESGSDTTRRSLSTAWPAFFTNALIPAYISWPTTFRRRRSLRASLVLDDEKIGR